MSTAPEIAAAALCIDFCGLHFNTPLVLLSGCVGFGEEYPRVRGFSHAAVGAVCLKGTTAQPRLGNASHRISETPSGMLNAIGLQNPGARRVVEQILPRLDHEQTRFIANVSGSTLQEYADVTRLFDDSEIAAIELNVSCPNVREGGMSFGNHPHSCAQIVQACRPCTDKPLITKLSPNQTDIAESARCCIEAGTDAFSVINTVTGMSIDIERRRPVLANVQGGVSGPAIRPIALLKVFQVYQQSRKHNIPIIGQGGIAGAEDAIAFLLAGSSAVGLGTALFYDPLICGKIMDGIAAYMRRHGVEHVSALVGALEQEGEMLDYS